jgi:hypothetical protein
MQIFFSKKFNTLNFVFWVKGAYAPVFCISLLDLANDVRTIV